MVYQLTPGLKKDNLFLAIKGKKNNGNKFINSFKKRRWMCGN